MDGAETPGGIALPAGEEFLRRPGLKKIPPYWYPYRTMAKERWLGRELLEIVSTEFRDRSIEYYRYALESGVTTVNGKIASPTTIMRNGDQLENIVHRHEPPVTSTPVKILHHDVEQQFIVINKPGSIPVHGTGRYFKNSLVEILQDDFEFEKVYTVNRLDRLTSGLMIIGLSTDIARRLSNEFVKGKVQKEYIARVKGQFPPEEVTCNEPLLTIDRQMGLNVVHPEGKPAQTIFKLLHYDANTDTSVLHCRPMTGRSHQIRVHLQFLGHPIANDWVYSEERIWGPKVGKGGIDVVPSEDRAPPERPEHLVPTEHGEQAPESSGEGVQRKLLPRETGHDIGMGSPVPLSREAVDVIRRLRNRKDENEDWSRWRDVIFRAKAALVPDDVVVKKWREEKVLPNPRKERPTKRRPGATPPASSSSPLASTSNGEPSSSGLAEPSPSAEAQTAGSAAASISSEANTITLVSSGIECIRDVPTRNARDSPDVLVAELQVQDAAPPAGETAAIPSTTSPISSSPLPPSSATQTTDQPTISALDVTQHRPQPISPSSQADLTHSEQLLYCPECYLPLQPDPNPENLYIFLHALRYTTSLGTYETEMPEWAAEGWEWDRER